MKVTVGGGYYDEKLGEMVMHPKRQVEVADDWQEKVLAEMAATPAPELIVMSPEIAAMFRAELDKL